MNIIMLMIPLALIFAGGFVWAFIWATSNGQYDDLDTPALRILKDEKVKENEKKEY